ncbi:MAG: dimethyl sulfoxide reductase anchor subunit [Chloroflexi bacterium]|nr:dimethyl sulfoxide reductase anchor subunit [Chloroflexota bacterium]
MDVREWALIAFTILSQMAVGSFIILGIVYFFASRKWGEEQADRLSDRALLAIGPVLVLGTLASFFHLGNPLNAYRAISNVGSSWISREILATLLFIAVGAVFAFMQWRKVSTSATRNIVALVAAAIGVVLVFSMSQIYMLRTAPAWNTIATPITFFTTTFLLGTLAVGAAYVANYAYVQRKERGRADTQSEILRAALRWLALASVVLVGVHLVVMPLYVAFLSASDVPAANEAAKILMDDYGVVFALRLVLVFLGAGILGAFVYRNASSPGREKIMGNLAYVAFAVVLVAEIMGRFLFYAMQTRVGL